MQGKKEINLKEDIKELIELSMFNGYMIGLHGKFNEGDSFNVTKEISEELDKVKEKIYNEFFK